VTPRAALSAAGAALVLFGTGLTCRSTPPGLPGVVAVPDPVYVRATVPLGVTCLDPFERDIRFVIDWGDGVVDTTVGKRSGDTAQFYHRWEQAGDYQVRLAAVLYDEEDRSSGWTDPVAVAVLANGIPSVTGFFVPRRVAGGSYTRYRAVAVDPDGDSVSFQFELGGPGAWSALVPSGVQYVDSQVFVGVDTMAVRCRARDGRGTESEWTEPFRIRVGDAGAVRWRWQEAGPVAGAAAVLAPQGEMVYVAAGDDLYAIDGVTGETRYRVSNPDQGSFGSPVYCAATGHLVVGSANGLLYAYTPTLAPVWQWPGSPGGAAWGSPAIDGSRLYCTRGDDSIHALDDTGGAAVPAAAMAIPGVADYCIIDGDGRVLVTGGNVLYRLAPGLDSIVWQTAPGDEDLHLVAAGADNTVYCFSDGGELQAVDQDRAVLWTVAPGGGIPLWTVCGDSLLFVAGGADSRLTAFDPATGEEGWAVRLEPGGRGLKSCPALTRAGYLFCQDRDDVVWCSRQADGRRVWSCECPDYLPVDRLPDPPDWWHPGLLVTGSGDIIVTGEQAVYCVSGYPGDSPADSPWPEWQHDGHHTGRLAP